MGCISVSCIFYKSIANYSLTFPFQFEQRSTRFFTTESTYNLRESRNARTIHQA